MNWFIKILDKFDIFLNRNDYESLPNAIKQEYLDYVVKTPSKFMHFNRFEFSILSQEQKSQFVNNLDVDKVIINDSFYDYLEPVKKQIYLNIAFSRFYLTEKQFNLFDYDKKLKYVNRYKNRYGLGEYLYDFWKQHQTNRNIALNREKNIDSILND